MQRIEKLATAQRDEVYYVFVTSFCSDFVFFFSDDLAVTQWQVKPAELEYDRTKKLGTNEIKKNCY